MLVVMGVVEQRYEAVMAVLRDGHTVVDVAEKFGVARQSVHRWIRRYEAGGLAGLADRSHRPISCPHQTPAGVEERIVAIRMVHPGWGPLRIAQLAKEGIDPVPSRVAIYRALVRRNLVDRQRRKRRREDYVRWERSRPNELWQMDVMGGVFLLDERELKVVTGIDDHSASAWRPDWWSGPRPDRCAPSSPRPCAAGAFPTRCSLTMARSSPAGWVRIPSRCSSTGSAGRTASSIASPGCGPGGGNTLGVQIPPLAPFLISGFAASPSP